MKTSKYLAALILLTLSVILLTGWSPFGEKIDIIMKQNVIVLLKFKTQPEKSDYTVSELTRLANQVKEEPNFVSIKIHVDPNDDTNIMLYEEWEDENYYNTEHMNTTYIKKFQANSVNFLAGPPEITFWNVVSTVVD